MGYAPYSAIGGTSNTVSRDVSGNSNSNNFNSNVTTIIGSGATTVLTVSSARYQVLGVISPSGQTFQLPDATTLTLGFSFEISNNSSHVLLVNNNASSLVSTVNANGYVRLVLVNNGNSSGTWSPRFLVNDNMANGNLLIGSGSGASPITAALTQSNGFSVTNGAGSITLSNLRNGARYVVSGVSGQGGYTTIGSAITQAVSDGASSSTPATILVWDGTYTENIVLSDYINLVAIGKSATVVGNATYASGTGSVYLTNMKFSTSNSSPAISITAAVSVYFNNCTISSSSSGNDLTVSNSGAVIQLNDCNMTATSTGSIFSITSASVTMYSCFMNSTSSGSTIAGSASVSLFGCNISDYYSITDTAILQMNASSMYSGINPIANLTSASAYFIAIASQLSATGTYLVAGSGGYFEGQVIITGTTSLVAGGVFTARLPWSGGVLTIPSLITTPAASAASTLALGTAYQNVLGYDVMLIVYISVTAATSGSILCGVGSTNAPTQQTIVNGITVAALTMVPVTVYLPSGYYAKISTSGTITAAISGQQVTPV